MKIYFVTYCILTVEDDGIYVNSFLRIQLKILNGAYIIIFSENPNFTLNKNKNKASLKLSYKRFFVAPMYGT